MTPRPWLAPVGAAFGAAARLRAALYARGVLPSGALAGPVISVGNIAVGGRGKTPVVAWIAETLTGAGVPVAILSRGYRGSFDGDVLFVSDGRTVLADAATAGDEPVMLAAQLPGVVVAVGRDRRRVGRAVEERFGRRVHVLDDGFQHLVLRRDLDVVCVDRADLADAPLPAGRLREHPSALARADVVLFRDSAEGEGPLPSGLGAATVLRWRRRAIGFFDAAGGRVEAPRRPWLLSGIADPAAFAADVRAQGCAPAGESRFPDHHPFAAADVSAAVVAAAAAGADALATTAKDGVRLPPMPKGAPPLAILRITAEIADEPRLVAILLAAAREAA